MTESYYILSHKPVEYRCSIGRYKMLQCGAAIADEKFGDEFDDSGDSISKKNKYWVETTAIYWIWKNCNADIKGHTQYRRFLSVSLDLVPCILDSYDIILAKPVTWGYPLERVYSFTHNINDLCDCEKIVKEKFPSYAKAYDDTMKNNEWLYFSNSFIAKRETYDDLCKFCFGVLEEFESLHKFTCYEDVYNHEKKFCNSFTFHPRIVSDFKKGHPGIDDMTTIQSWLFGYLFERMLNVYVRKNNLKTYECGEYITNILK